MEKKEMYDTAKKMAKMAVNLSKLKDFSQILLDAEGDNYGNHLDEVRHDIAKLRGKINDEITAAENFMISSDVALSKEALLSKTDK